MPRQETSSVTRASLAAFAAFGLALSAAQAAPIVHDEIADFASITRVQGLQGSGSAVASGRSNLGNMFDADEVNSFFSLGLGGTLTLTLAPSGQRLTGGSLIERTNLPGSPSGHPEVVKVFLGVDGEDFVLLGELRNSHAGGSAVTATGAPGALLYTGAAGSGTSARSLFSIGSITGDFNTVRFEDISPRRRNDNDGFDIAALSFTSEAIPAGPGDLAQVPTPMALGLFGLALAGLLAARRLGA